MLEFIAFVLIMLTVIVGLSFVYWALGSILLISKSSKFRCIGFKLYAQSDLAKPSNVADRCPCTDEACKSCTFWTCSKYPHRKENNKNEKYP